MHKINVVSGVLVCGNRYAIQSSTKSSVLAARTFLTLTLTEMCRLRMCAKYFGSADWQWILGAWIVADADWCRSYTLVHFF